ncbi:type-F conjugative transfer system secretin TraK [Thiothrix sp.]|jgi:type-F conjugative transfer system secretin TraK|uniref:TraK domain-containing protein n=1 Tax=Thiothrix sp. TaxID=1032 RepID=UPI00257AE16B|nr:type-F conjugative transfer system secretin TraK [Thiothrix sp.]
MNIQTRWRYSLGVTLGLALSATAIAADFTVNDGDTVTAKIARDGLTRISVQGARIEQIFSADGKDLTFQVDKQNGQVFVRYKGGKEQVLDAMELPGGGSVKRKQTTGSGKTDFSAFVTDDGGRTFNLNLSVVDAPSQSIVLKPMVVEKAKSGRVVIQNDLSLPSEVMALMQVMTANVEDVSGYDVARDLSESQALWSGADYVRVASYEGDTLLGETYTLTNRTGSEMRIVESEFQGKGVLGVAVKNPILQANEFTYVYVVREVVQ